MDNSGPQDLNAGFMAPAGLPFPADEVGLFEAAEGAVRLGWGEASGLAELAEA